MGLNAAWPFPAAPLRHTSVALGKRPDKQNDHISGKGGLTVVGRRGACRGRGAGGRAGRAPQAGAPAGARRSYGRQAAGRGQG